MRYFEKQSGFFDFLNSASGHHDIDEISRESGIPKDRAWSWYRKLGVPNKMIYPKENVIEDFQELDKLNTHYYALNEQLMKTKPGSPEEKVFLSKNKKELDKRLLNFMKYSNELGKKYYAMKEGKK